MRIGIEDLERLNALPKELSKPDMDLEKLKLVVSFLDNEEQGPVHSFKDDEIAFMRGFEELVVIGRLSVDELVDYFKRVKGKERGLVKIAFDAVNQGYSVMDEIVRRSDIPGDLANAFTRVYGERLKKMEEIAKRYIDKYGLPAVEADINSLLEESRHEREKIIERLNQSLSNLEGRLGEGDNLKEEKNQLEETLRGLEREAVIKEVERAALTFKLREFEDDKKDAWERYEKVESAWSESIGEIEERRKALDARELELKEEEERQRAELKDTARKTFEDELRDISGLKEELEKKEEELKSERAGLEYERREVEERLGKLRTILEGGEVKRFVTRDVAKIQELNYVGRFDVKMIGVPRTIYDPIERKEWKIRSMSYHHKFNDVDNILDSLKMNYEEAMRKLPLNLRSRYVVADKKYKLFGKDETKVIIEAAVLGHLLDYAESGFDTRSVTLSELLSVLTRYIDSAELGNYFHVLGIASVTGFDKRVFEHVNSGDFHNNFISRYVSLCLVDLETGEVFYNESDERIKGYLDLFKPVFDEEKVRAIKEYVVGRLELKDFAVLDRVVEEATDGGEEDKRLAKKVFYDLEKEGIGEVQYDKEFGLVVKKWKNHEISQD
jgi:hypothetical protein